MGRNKKTTKLQNSHNAVSVLISSAVFITLYINPAIADPFNSAKLFFLILSSSWLFGYLIHYRNIENNKYSKLFFLIIIFEITLFIATIFTDNKYTAFFGGSQRQLGFITYSAFAIYMLVSAKYFSFKAKGKLYLGVFTIGIIYVIYGLMQHTGNDPFKWINQYNPIIGTLGNPNFAGAFMAMIATLSFSFLFNNSLSIFRKFIFLFITIGLLVNIYFSSARQGILSVAAGFLVFLNIQIFKKNIKLGITSLFFTIVITLFSILGMLQSGPLANYLYKNSVSLRGYYWRAGLNMLRHNLLTGVGIDRYGENFKLYKEMSFSLKHGFELNSSNAHNVPIQLFATGGLFVGLSYLVIVIYIFYRGVKGIMFFQNNEQIFLSGVFSSWIAYQLQSIVSIDNIGLTIWGWLLGGAIVGLTASKSNQLGESKKEVKNNLPLINGNILIQPIVSGILLVSALVLVVTLSKGESNTMEVRNRFSPQIQNNSNNIKTYADLVISDYFAQPAYKLEVSDYLFRSGFRSEAITELERLTKSDPINPTFLNSLAITYESTGRYNDSIIIRTMLIKYDPQNAKNYFLLAMLYKDTGNIKKAIEMKEKILSFAPNSEQADLVKKEIQP